MYNFVGFPKSGHIYYFMCKRLILMNRSLSGTHSNGLDCCSKYIKINHYIIGGKYAANTGNITHIHEIVESNIILLQSDHAQESLNC